MANKLTGEKWHNNPRQITKKDFDLLKKNLEELGDLSGILHDLNSNQYPGGNQRSEVLKDGEVHIIETFDPPTPTGTVAHGFILYKGEKYTYRQVRWTEEQCRRAVITANSMGGTWDMEVLANEWADLPLADWGVDIPSRWLKEPEPEPESEQETTTGIEKLQIIVDCSDSHEQTEIFNKLKDLGYKCRYSSYIVE